MNNKEKQASGGRPRNVEYENLKRIVDDYFLCEAQGDVSLLSKKGRFSQLAKYASNGGLDYKATDFSRCKQLICYLDELTSKYSDVGKSAAMNIPGYVPIDVDYFIRPDVPIKERIQYLLEQDKHYKNLHINAAKALEVYDSQCREIEDLQRRLQVEVQKCRDATFDMHGVNQENKKLLSENRYLKRYIREYIEPAVAEAVLTGNFSSNLTAKAVALTPSPKKEAAVTSLSEILSTDAGFHQGEDDADRLLSMIGERLNGYEKED